MGHAPTQQSPHDTAHHHCKSCVAASASSWGLWDKSLYRWRRTHRLDGPRTLRRSVDYWRVAQPRGSPSLHRGHSIHMDQWEIALGLSLCPVQAGSSLAALFWCSGATTCWLIGCVFSLPRVPMDCFKFSPYRFIISVYFSGYSVA